MSSNDDIKHESQDDGAGKGRKPPPTAIGDDTPEPNDKEPFQPVTFQIPPWPTESFSAEPPETLRPLAVLESEAKKAIDEMRAELTKIKPSPAEYKRLQELLLDPILNEIMRWRLSHPEEAEATNKVVLTYWADSLASSSR